MAGPMWHNPNGGTQLFQFLNQSVQVLNPNYNITTVNAFKRAMKVFYLSYPESTAQITPHQNLALSQYIQHMGRLYEIDPAQLRNVALYADPLNEALQEMYSICVSVKDVIGNDQLQDPFLIISSPSGPAGVIDLNPTLQTFTPLLMQATFDELRLMRRDVNQYLTLTIQGSNWAQPDQPLNQLLFRMANTNPEGYEDWFNFGRGVQVLIRVEYMVTQERNMLREDVAKFHLHTIDLMLRRRLSFISNLTSYTGHQEFGSKNKLILRRPFVNPQSEDMFWSIPKTAQTLVPDRTRPRRPTRTVKFVDMQINFDKISELEESVCVCSEWCNWNAFFHHNPVYRFLMVRHCQLFMGPHCSNCCTNVADMYLSVSIINGCIPNTRPPILELMRSANEYRNRYYNTYVQKGGQYRDQYDYSHPEPQIMNAVSYNKLRYEMNVMRLCFASIQNPFTEFCVEKLLNYYNVLMNLHNYHSRNPRFVNPLELDLWFSDLEFVSRNKYKEFMTRGFNLCCQNVAGGSDYLFTVDNEYAHRVWPEQQGVGEIKRARELILRTAYKFSPFNIRVLTNKFLNTFAGIYKFLSKVEPMLPKAHKLQAIEMMFQCYADLDSEFVDISVNANERFNFTIPAIAANYQHLEQNFYVFYTLKIYFFAFEIQKYFIKNGVQYNSYQNYDSPVSTQFNFIFDNTRIHDTYTSMYHHGRIFPFAPTFETQFDDFYTTFYGVPHHESLLPATMPDHNVAITSAYAEHRKLFVWWRNYGNIRLKFTQITESLRNSLNQIRDSSVELCDSWVIPAMRELNHQTQYEVYDHLMYYLVKANCSVILTNVGMFLKQMHNLMKEDLVQGKISYSLCKPGWVPLMRTFTMFLSAVDNVRQYKEEFEDEFDRIANTCDETKKTIKEIYRQVFGQILMAWVEELIQVMNLALQNMITVNLANVTEFLVMHIASGIAFFCAFCDEFRYEFNTIRKQIRTLFQNNPCPPLLNQVQFSAISLILTDYFLEWNVVRNGMPYQSYVWQVHQYLITLRDSLTQLTPQQVHLNLQFADTI